MKRRKWYILLFLILLLFLTSIAASYVLFQPTTQEWLVRKYLEKLSKDHNTTITYKSAEIDIFDNIQINELFIQDQLGDTLLYAGLFTTDVERVDIFGKDLDLGAVHLKDAVIRIHRINQDDFNFDFLVKGNSSNEKKDNDDKDVDKDAENEKKQEENELTIDSTEVKKLVEVFNEDINENAEKKDGLKLDLDQVLLENIRFTFIDEYDYTSIDTDIERLNVLIDEIDLSEKKLNVQSLSLENPFITVISKDSDLEKKKKEKKKDDNSRILESGDWNFLIQNVDLINGDVAVQIDNPIFENNGSIDFKNIALTDFNISTKNLTFLNDTLNTNLEKLSVEDISGFKLTNLSSQVELSNEHLLLDDLEFKTPYSNLGNKLLLNYNGFTDWKKFEEKVKIDADIVDSYLGVKDLEYFIKNLSSKLDGIAAIEQIGIAGKIKGKVNKFKGDDLELTAGKHTYFKGRLRLRDFPDVENMFIDFKLEELRTRTEDVLTFFPKLKFPKGYEKLGAINFVGKFTGFPNDFVANGLMETEIGSVQSDLNMKISDVARYSGELSLMDFNLKTFLEDDNFGMASFSTKINGQGLKTKDLVAKLDGNIERFDYKGYKYEDVVVNGTFDRKLFKGAFKANDENFALDFDGQIDLNDSIPKFGFNTEVFALNLKKLKLTDENIIIQGKTSVDFGGNNIDNIVGSGVFEDVFVSRNDSIYELGSFDFVSEIDTSYRTLQLNADYLTAYFNGDFSFKELPNKFKRFLNIYFPYRFAAVEASDTPANIEFGIDILDEIKFEGLIDSKLKEIGKGKIEGRFNDETRQLDLDVDIPKLVYNNIEFDSIKLRAVSDQQSIESNLSLRKIQSGKQALNWIEVAAEIYQDTIDVNLKVEKNSAFNNLRLDGLVYTNSDTLTVDFEKMDLTVAEKLWSTDKGRLTFKNKGNYSLENFKLEHDEQYVSLSGLSNAKEELNTTDVKLTNIDLEEILQLVNKENLGIRGKANGVVNIQDAFTAPIFTGDIAIDSFELKNVLLGFTELKAKKLPEKQVVDLSASITSKEYIVDAMGYYNMGVVGIKEDDYLDIDFDLQRANVSFFETFLTESISNTTGWGKGDLKLSGNPTSLAIDGGVTVFGAGSTIKFLNTHYSAANSKLIVENNVVNFNDVLLYDKFQNVANVNGQLFLRDFKNLGVEIDAISDNFLFLDTKRTDNESFYGQALASGVVTFTGPFKNINIDIAAKSKKGTKLYVPVSYDTEVSGKSFFTFVDKKDTITNNTGSSNKISTGSIFNLDMDMDITTDAEMQLIFDYYAGDIIRSRGNGAINLKYASNGNFKMFGNYIIDDGDYLFTLKNIVNKKFQLEKGGTIMFTGDPYSAMIDIDASYKVRNTSLAELVPEGDLIGNANSITNTNVILNLLGTLSSPNIKFQIEVPQASGSLQNSALRRIEEMNNDSDPSELNRQIFGLLVLNEFLPQQSLLGNDFIQEGITTTVSEFLSNQLTSLLSSTINEIIPDSDLSVNWINYEGDVDITNSNFFDDRNEIELMFTKRLFNDRVIIDIGGNFDVGSSDNADDWNAVISDFNVKYKITPDGFYFLKIFSKTDREALAGTFRRAGVSISVSEEFNDLKDLKNKFKVRRDKRRKRKSLRKNK